MTKKNVLKKNKNILFKLIFLFLILLFIFSIYNIINWIIDNGKTNQQIKKITQKIEITETKDNENTNIIEPEKQEPLNSPYWSYIKMPLINVDFSELKEINSETIGWINFPGTNINYPFVQAKDNNYYLSHSFDKSINKAGWIFLDYRNNLDNLDKNIIIYGHSRVNNTMFGSLRNTLKESWFNNIDNHIIRLSTEKENTIWQIFSVYTIPETNDYIITNFNDENEFNKFINLISSRSIYKFTSNITSNDNILTLSTCYKTNERIVVHAKLIKKEARD